MPLKLTRRQYAEMFGPTVGDRVRLADTELFVQVERDLIAEGGGYGNEIKFGGGKVIRDGMGQSSTARDAESLDMVITNALILDAQLGIIKADIGIKHGIIVGIGHAGNPGIQRGLGSVYPDPKTGQKNPMIVGAGTEVLAGEGNIITAGGIATSLHLGCSVLPLPMFQPVNPHEGKTINRRAGCGRSASPVRREGELNSIGTPYPYP